MATSSPFYALSAQSLIGDKEYSFSQLAGKVVVVVNTASQCGYTVQFGALEQLYKDRKDQGLVILGFPSNQFGSQDPGTNEEIGSFCVKNFGVSFPMMAKCDVNGPDTHPVYAFLKAQKKQLFMERIKWNFEKFVVNRKGEVVERFSSITKPEDMTATIDALLAESA